VPPWVKSPNRATFVVGVVGVLAAGLVGLLLLNIAMQKGAFELARLDAQANDLQTRQQALDLEVDRLASPARLAQRASAQGMVANPNPVFLDLATGEVVGRPTPAAAAPAPAGQAPAVDPPRRPQPSPAEPRREGRRSGGGER
jgi:hypothetical protein